MRGYRMRRQTVLAAASLIALVAAAPAVAQSPEPLAIGASVEGEIGGGDAAASDAGYAYDAYAIEARAGQRFEAVMRAGAFDAYLEVFAPGEVDTPLGHDDDGLGEKTDARLRFSASRSGTYILRARTL